jgi:hypothetical protein
MSAWMGSQNYDWSSILFAIVNTVTGIQKLVEGLETLNAFQIVGIFLLPIIFLHWYFSIDIGEPSWFGAYLVLLLSYFASHTILLKNITSWWPENIAVVTLIFIIVLIPNSTKSNRTKMVMLLLVLLLFNLYHTFALFFVLIIGTMFISDTVYCQWTNYSKAIPVVLFSLIISIFFLVGTQFNSRFAEIISRVFTGFLSTSPTPASAIEGPLISGSTATNELQSPNARQAGKIINYFSSVIVIFLFFINYIHNKGNEHLNNIHNRTVLLSLFAFPFIIGGFYLFYGQIGQVVVRTQYIGIYFVILTAALLIRHPRDSYRKLTTVLVVLMILSAIPTAVLSGLPNSPHTLEEERAITHTGSHLDDQSYVFSDAALAAPLGYYDIRGIASIRILHNKWKGRLNNIYYQSDASTALASINATIDSSRIRNSPRSKKFYIFLSSSSKENGVHLLSETTVPTNIDPRSKFDRAHQVNKIYATGNISLFQYEKNV